MRASILNRGTLRRTAMWTALALAAGLAGPTVVAPAASAAPGDITTFAGGGPCPADVPYCGYAGSSGGDGGPATAAQLTRPYGLATASGSAFISEGHSYQNPLLAGDRVRTVAPDGTISLLAGGGTPPNGDGGPATDAILNNPTRVTVDAAGNLFFIDPSANYGHTMVRTVDHATGVITTVSTVSGYVRGVAVDAAGTVFVSYANVVARVNPGGSTTTVAGTPCPAANPSCYYGASYSGDGGPATSAQLGYTGDLAFGPGGSLYVISGFRVLKIVPGADGVITGAPDETITTAAGNGVQPAQDGTPTASGDGGPATAAGISYPEGIGTDPSGNLFIASIGFDANNTDNRIRRVDHATGIITTVAGGAPTSAGSGLGGPATSAVVFFPLDVAADASGDLVIATESGALRKVDAAGIITTAAGSSTCVTYCYDGSTGFSGDGGPATAARIGDYIPGVVFDGAGNVVFADLRNNRVRRVDTAGIISTVAGGGAGDGLPATATFVHDPKGLATDAAGNVLIADCGDARVRKVDHATGIITTAAGGGSGAAGRADGLPATSYALNCPTGLAAAGSGTAVPAGTLFIADCGDNKVYGVDPSTGAIRTVAGTGAAGFSGDNNQATRAKLSCPSDVAVDASGSLLIADTANSRIRKVDAATAKITTVAGDGTIGFGSDGVVATKTSLTNPSSVTVDGAGNLVVTDRYARVRKVDAATARITTVAGDGVPGFNGDGGPATLAQMSSPTQVRVDGAGNLLITDRDNARVRKVAAGTPPPPPPPPLSGCGQVITKNTTLTSDIGPCAHDGITIRADGITVNLNGHKIIGLVSSDGTGADGSAAGIRLANRTGVTIKGATSPGPAQGSVTGFNAGVAIIGGSKNTVANLTVHDNVGPLGPNDSSEFGDGIVLLFSAANILKDNVVAHNGPYDGIGVLGKGSDNNTLTGNTISDTFTYPGDQGGDGTGEGIIFQPFVDINLPRGVTTSGNKAVGNTVARNDTAGISTISNQGATIQNNTVVDNGRIVDDPYYGPYALYPGVGIGVQRLFLTGFDTHDLVQGNTVHGSGNDGIQDLNTNKNRFLANTSTGNGRDGYGVDLADYSDWSGTSCSANVWSANTWGIAGYYPDCTANGGSGPNPPTSGHSSPYVANPRVLAPDRGTFGNPRRHLSSGVLAQAQP